MIIGETCGVVEILSGDENRVLECGAGAFLAGDICRGGFLGFEGHQGLVGGADEGSIKPEEEGDVGPARGVSLRIRADAGAEVEAVEDEEVEECEFGGWELLERVGIHEEQNTGKVQAREEGILETLL